MLARRVLEHVRRLHWSTIAVDLAIVVLGVFLGIQAANWNADRAEQRKAKAYLARIDANLESDLRSIDLRVAFWRQVADYGKAAIHHAETGELVDGSAWKTVLAYYQASQLWQWSTSDATYQEMRSGGELGLIHDEQLRGALMEYYVQTGAGIAYLFYLQPEYRKIVRGLTPSVVADHIWSACWQQPNLHEQKLLDCDSPVSEAEAQAVLAGYRASPNLLAELRFWVANQGVALNVIQNFKPLLRDMLDRDRAEPSR